jgi:hypothetical protein
MSHAATLSPAVPRPGHSPESAAYEFNMFRPVHPAELFIRGM